MSLDQNLIKLTGPVLAFGGPYSNLRATEALLEEAHRLQIPLRNVLCTGDLAAYCAEPREVIELIRRSGIHVVMGNCEESLAIRAEGCGCGFPSASRCATLAEQWYSYADHLVDADSRMWMASLPRRIDIEIGGRRLALLHGGATQINRFVYLSSSEAIREELAVLNCDGVIAGHCGLPFTREVDGRLWHNTGVVGMPANDGTPRVWFSVFVPASAGIIIEHHALNYDYRQAAAKMRERSLPEGYAACIEGGIWPSCDALTPAEIIYRGTPLTPGRTFWRFPNTKGEDARWPIRHD
jgi:predicted phosphodiesterase